MTGKRNEAFNTLFHAIRLENVKNLDENEKKAFKYVEQIKEPPRYDNLKSPLTLDKHFSNSSIPQRPLTLFYR